MLRGYRLYIAAIGLSLAAHHPNLEAKPQQGAPAERSASALENIATTYNKQAEGAQRSPESNPCQPGDDQRNSDSCAQWKAADAAADSAWWAAIGGFASAISTVLVLIALYLAFRSNAIARGTAHSQLRAYVTLGIIDLRRRSTKAGEKKWFLDVDLENNGQSPAFIRHFHIMIGWRRSGVAADIIDEVFQKSRDIQVVIASGKPFGVSVEIEADFSPAPLHEGDELAILGRIEYADIFTEKRITAYRQYADHACWERGAGVVSIFTSMDGNTCT